MERQYALMLDRTLMLDGDNAPLITGFLPETPDGYSGRYPAGCRWLPIENVDSEPFDQSRHWRDTPTYEVRGDMVARVYPVQAVRRIA